MTDRLDITAAIGQQLRQAREAQKLTLDQVASATRMRDRYLRALEEGNYDVLPSMAQARGFLRAYAGYLKLDPDLLLMELDGQTPAGPVSSNLGTSSSQLQPRAGGDKAQPKPKGSRTLVKPIGGAVIAPPDSGGEISSPPVEAASAPNTTESAISAPANPRQGQTETGPRQDRPGTRNPSSGAASSPVVPSWDYSLADQAFVDIGRSLTSQRELLGLSLEDVERYTHLRRHYLKALETGRLDDLPSPVQGRGMLANYASFLGMEAEPLLLRFAEGMQARLTVRQAVQTGARTGEAAANGAQTINPPSRPRRRRTLPTLLQRLLSPDILIGVTFAIFLVIFVVWGAIRIFAMNSRQSAVPTAPSIADVLLATTTPSPMPSELPQKPTATVPQLVVLPGAAVTDATAASQPPAAVQAAVGAPGVQVYVTVSQRAWLRAIVDGKVEFEGRVIPGSAYPFVGSSSVEILTSNGAALQIFFNQQDLGVMGTFGQVVDRIFTPGGILTPTPTITRTPAPTLRVTPTSPATQPQTAGTPASP